MKSQISLFLRINLILAIVEGIICLALFLALPSEKGNTLFLGYSSGRLSIAAILISVLAVCAAHLALIWNAKTGEPTIGSHILRKIEATSGDARKVKWLLTGFFLIAFISAFALFLWPASSPVIYRTYLHRFGPILLWSLLVTIQIILSFWITDKRKIREKAETFLGLAVLALCIYFVLVYFLVVSARVGYPYELEWIEGGFLDLVNRFGGGQPLYQEPSLQFAPYIGMPFFVVLGGLLSKSIGNSFALLRSISLFASLGTGGLIYLSIRREGLSRFYAFIGTAFFAAAYAITGAWYDLARVDSLFVFLMILTVYILRFRSSWQAELLAAFFLALAVLTKQTAAILAPALFLACILVNRRRGWVFGFSFGTFLVAVFFTLNSLTHGWFWFYVFYVPTFHNVDANQLLSFFTVDTLPILISLLFAAVYFMDSFRRRRLRSRIFPLAYLAGTLALSWTGRAVNGAYINHLIPLCTGLALLLPSVLALANETRLSIKWRISALFLLLVQLLVLVYNPLNVVPTSQDRRAGEQIVSFLKGIEGDVFIPRHPYLAELAGKSGYAHLARFGEVLGFYGSEVPDVGPSLRKEIEQAIQEGRFAAILLDNKGWMLRNFPSILDYYHEEAFIDFENSAVFRPVSGLSTRPQFLFLRNEDP